MSTCHQCFFELFYCQYNSEKGTKKNISIHKTMLTLGQQLLAKKKKEAERVAIPSGVPTIDTSCFVKLVSGDGHIFICHKDTAAVSKVLKPLIYPHLATPADQAMTEMILQSGEAGEVVVDGCARIQPPPIVYPLPKPPISTADKSMKDVMALVKQQEEDEAKLPPPPPPCSAVLPNLLNVGNSDITALQVYQQGQMDGTIPSNITNTMNTSVGNTSGVNYNNNHNNRSQNNNNNADQSLMRSTNGDQQHAQFSVVDDYDGIGATAIRFPYISAKLLEIVVQYFHYKQRYEHAADKRPPFNIDPSVALELLRVSTKLQC